MAPKLVITVTPVQGNTYKADYTFTPPGGQLTTAARTFELDAGRLNGTDLDPDAHGFELGAALFGHGTDADPTLPLWRQARDFPSPDALRVELVLDSYDEALRRVRWEALADPDPQKRTPRLLANQNLRFYRRLHCANPKLAARVRTRAAVRALVLVASPRDIDGAHKGRTFEARDALAGETGPVVAALARVPTTVLVSAHKAATGANHLEALGVPPRDGLAWGGRPSLTNLVRHLGDGYDLVVVLAHGVLDDGKPILLLEDDNGKQDFALGVKIADEIEALAHRPALVVVASCQSSGVPLPVDPDRPASGRVRPDEADTALAACLGRAGVGAVLSMHGNVDRETATTFVKTFLEALTTTGEIDGAAVAGRRAVADPTTYPDPWAPILASRLPANRLWAEPTVREGRAFDGWPRLMRRLERGRCVPVLGPRVLEHLVGTSGELAAAWAKDLATDVPAREDWDIPNLTQYLGPVLGADEVREEYYERLQRALTARTKQPPSGSGPEYLLADLTAAAARAAEKDTTEVFRMLARLRLPVYLTTCPDDALFDALKRNIGAGPTPAGAAAERGPFRQVCDWLRKPPDADPPAGGPADPLAPRQPIRAWPVDNHTPPAPTRDRPLVCHLGGHLSDPHSVLLSDDHYFRFLVRMAVTSSYCSPSVLASQFVNTDLLFLGFRLDDVAFRTFVEVFMSLEWVQNRRVRKPGGEEEKGFDVAVQLDPGDAAAASDERVQQHIERLFNPENSPGVNIRIYWQGLRSFLHELDARWQTK